MTRGSPTSASLRQEPDAHAPVQHARTQPALNNSTNDDLADLGLATLVPDDQLNDGDLVSARTRPLATARQSGESARLPEQFG